MHIWRGEGRAVLRELGEGLDELHRHTSTPLTARRPWLQAWVDCYPDYHPVAVAVTGDDGCQAAALFGVRRVRGHSRVVACGHGPSDAAMMPALDEASAERLVSVLAGDFRARSRWSMSLRHVAPDDLVVPRLGEQLRSGRVVSGDVSPVLRADAGPSLREYVSGSHRRGVSRVRNRMQREGLDPRLDHLSERADIAALLPEVERVHRARDQALGRRSLFDVPSHRDFFRRVVLDHSALDGVTLTTLHLQDRLAAYVLCFVDGDAHRMWSTRFDPAWERFSPGKLAMEESVEHALTAGCGSYDFMRGEERYKFSYANTSVTAQDLFASSGRARSVATAGALAVRARMRQAHARGGRGARFVEMTRRLRDRRGAA